MKSIPPDSLEPSEPSEPHSEGAPDDTENERLGDLYAENAKPLVGKLLKLLKLDTIYLEARGDELTSIEQAPGRPPETRGVLDFLGGYGSTLLGHNHPAIVGLLRESYGGATPTHVQASVRKYSGLLAQKINEIVAREQPGAERAIVHLCNTGAEAVELAIKHALMQHQARRKLTLQRLRQASARLAAREPKAPALASLARCIDRIEGLEPVLLALRGSYHGKTAGALAATSNERFKQMFGRPALAVRFIDPRRPSACEEALDELVEPTPLPDLPFYSPVIGLLFEPIQGEGGIEPLSDEFVASMESLRQRYGVPLIADEIQSGTYRTGRFLACTWHGLAPDYFLLGKSLGGGVAKIAALAVRASLYQDDLSWVHSSTFAEDEISSQVALRTLSLLEALDPDIASRAARFERRLREGMNEVALACPGLVREVRGRGFLIGIELDLEGKAAAIPHLLKFVHNTGYGSYLVVSWLLNQAGIRVGVTLSRPEVLRVEPSALVSDTALDRLIEALREFAQLVQARRMLQLTHHFFREPLTPNDLELVSPRVAPAPDPTAKEGVRTIGFVSHTIDFGHLRLFDPMFRRLGRAELTRFHRKFGEVAKPFVYHDQIIRSRTGARVRVVLVGSLRTSEFFESSLRANDFQALDVTAEMIDLAREHGAELVGLGQYTSIVSENGTLLDGRKVALTTGNSLTAGFAYQALERGLSRAGRPLAGAHFGVVGANGNICNVIAQLLADRAGALTLVGRDTPESMRRLEQAATQIAACSALPREQIKITGNLSALAGCDGVLVGTNSTRQIVRSEHLKEGAVVIDLSVPSNLDPRLLAERADVNAFHGGLAELWDGQIVDSGWLGLPRGQLYACLAETIALGLHGHRGHGSFGPLTREGVTKVLEIASEAGISLGALVPLRGAV